MFSASGEVQETFKIQIFLNLLGPLNPTSKPSNIDLKTFQNVPQNPSKSPQKPPKIHPKTDPEGFWALFGNRPRIFSNFQLYFEALETPLGPQVGPKLRPCWVSWGGLGGSWALLGGYLAVWNPKKTEIRCNCFVNSIWKRILIDFDSENGTVRPSKIIKFHWFYIIFQLFAVF